MHYRNGCEAMQRTSSPRCFAVPPDGPPETASLLGTLAGALDGIGQCEHVLADIEDAVNGPAPAANVSGPKPSHPCLGDLTVEVNGRISMLLGRLMFLSGRIKG